MRFKKSKQPEGFVAPTVEDVKGIQMISGEQYDAIEHLPELAEGDRHNLPVILTRKGDMHGGFETHYLTVHEAATTSVLGGMVVAGTLRIPGYELPIGVFGTFEKPEGPWKYSELQFTARAVGERIVPELVEAYENQAA